MNFLTLTDIRPADVPYPRKTEDGRFIVSEAYGEEETAAFLAVSEEYCLRVYLHNYREEFFTDESCLEEKTGFRAIRPDELVIEDGKAAGILCDENLRNSRAYSLRQRLLRFGSDCGKLIRNEHDCHTGDEWSCDIYSVYTLFRRADMPEGAVLGEDPEREQ